MVILTSMLADLKERLEAAMEPARQAEVTSFVAVGDRSLIASWCRDTRIELERLITGVDNTREAAFEYQRRWTRPAGGSGE